MRLRTFRSFFAKVTHTLSQYQNPDLNLDLADCYPWVRTWQF